MDITDVSSHQRLIFLLSWKKSRTVCSGWTKVPVTQRCCQHDAMPTQNNHNLKNPMPCNMTRFQNMQYTLRKRKESSRWNPSQHVFFRGRQPTNAAACQSNVAFQAFMQAGLWHNLRLLSTVQKGTLWGPHSTTFMEMRDFFLYHIWSCVVLIYVHIIYILI